MPTLLAVSPLSAILSALSCRLLWTELAWLPAIEAHHFPLIVIVALFGYGVVVVLGRTGVNFGAGMTGGCRLPCSPHPPF